MAKQLTDRQKQIKGLLDKGKSPREVADALGITENAVYQMRRRMKPTKTANSAKPARAPARKPAAKTAAKAPARRRATPRKPATASPPLLAGTVKPTSPLEAIAQRRKAIEAQLQATAKTLDEAIKMQESAEKAHTEALAKVEPELEQLKTAEAVLTGKIRSVPARKATHTRSNGKAKTPPAPPRSTGDTASAPEPATPSVPPETVGGGAATLAAHLTGTTPEGAAVDAARAEAPAPVEHEVNAPSPVVPNEEERPGVPTLAEFEQPEVEFVE